MEVLFVAHVQSVTIVVPLRPGRPNAARPILSPTSRRKYPYRPASAVLPPAAMEHFKSRLGPTCARSGSPRIQGRSLTSSQTLPHTRQDRFVACGWLPVAIGALRAPPDAATMRLYRFAKHTRPNCSRPGVTAYAGVATLDLPTAGKIALSWLNLSDVLECIMGFPPLGSLEPQPLDEVEQESELRCFLYRFRSTYRFGCQLQTLGGGVSQTLGGVSVEPGIVGSRYLFEVFLEPTLRRVTDRWPPCSS